MEPAMTQGRKPNHPIDKHVGAKIREARRIRGLSQTQLGEALSPAITFQQIQKYEKGTNRVSASRLWEIARALNVDVLYFFESATAPGENDRVLRSVPNADEVYFSSDEIELVQLYRQVEGAHLKGSVREIVRAVAAQLANPD